MNTNDKLTSLYPKERAVCRTASFRSSVLSLILDILHHQPTQKNASKSLSGTQSTLHNEQKQKVQKAILFIKKNSVRERNPNFFLIWRILKMGFGGFGFWRERGEGKPKREVGSRVCGRPIWISSIKMGQWHRLCFCNGDQRSWTFSVREVSCFGSNLGFKEWVLVLVF